MHPARDASVHAPGILRAEVLKDGAVVAREQLVSAGAPVTLRSKPEETQMEPTSQDFAFIRIEAVVARGAVRVQWSQKNFVGFLRARLFNG
ncbi:MAG TPA: hypothetical protein VKY92_19395 [Verrucomicrobiae bacterium]|nr:hypothetical protein [Verrucomicrobiae bacterium]